MTDQSSPLYRLRLSVPVFLLSPALQALPIDVQQRFADRIEAVLAGLESKESYVRDASISLTSHDKPLIIAHLGDNRRVEVTILKRVQESREATLECIFYRPVNGEEMHSMNDVAHQSFEKVLHGYLF